MNDTDITPGQDSHHHSDSTEKSVPAKTDPTDKPLAEEKTEKSISDGSLRQRGQEPVSSSPDEPTEESLAPEDQGQGPDHRATIVPNGNSSTDLMAKPADTDYAALLSPDRETFIPEAALSPGSPDQSPSGYPSVPGFEILGILGRGGMGVVYKARHESLRRLVALKMILHGSLASPADLARFHIEAEAIARLQHPNIVQIHEIGNYQGLPFLSLEFVNGGSLGQKLEGIPQANADAAEMVETLARAMAFAHQRGIVHRDLKPGNILLQRGTVSGGVVSGGVGAAHLSPTLHQTPLTAYQPKIVDFGLAKRLDELSAQTHSGAIMGTPSYMSPEQAASRIKEIGPAADIYALGAILYEMLTGRPPFRAEKPMNTIRMVIQDEPVPPVRLNPGAARDLETICLKCLQKEIAKRYTTAQDLADDLHRFLQGAPITARPVTPTERALKWVKRRPALAAVYVLLIMVTLLGGLGGILAWRWYETNTAKRSIEEALEREQRALDGQRQAREDLDRHFYIHRINLAWRDWSAGEVMGARKNLEDCEPRRRQWEWHYLHRQVFPELLTLADNDEEPLQVLFAPAGNSLVIVSKNNHVRARDASTGEELPAPLGTMAVQCVAYRADNKVLAAAGTDRTVVLQDVASGQLLHTLRGHQEAVVHLAFSPDGTRLASASSDKTAKIWDVATGKNLVTLKGHTAEVAWVAFRPDGRQLATASWDTSVKIWDPVSGAEIAASPLRHAEAVTQVVYSPDGKRLATACFDKTVKLWDANTYTELPPLLGPMEDINYLAFSPDGSRIAFAKRDKTVKLFDVNSGKQLFFLQGHLNEVMQVAYSPDGGRLVTTGKDKTVRVWDATTSKETLVLQGAGDSNYLVYCPDGHHRLAACVDKMVQVWDTDSGKKLASCVGHEDEIQHLAYHPSGLRLASAGKDKAVKIWDAGSGQEIHTLVGHAGAVTQVAFNADGSLLVSGDTSGVIKVWDADSGKELFSLSGLTGASAMGAVRHLVFHPDGRHLAVAVKNGPVRIWDVRSGAESLVLPAWSDDADYLAYNPLGDQLAIAGKDRGVTLWNIAPDIAGASRTRGHTEAVVHLAFSTDGGFLATASLDKTVTLWNAATGESLFTLRGHIGPVVSVAFSPNSRRLASASWDRTVKLWDVQTGKELLSLPLQPEEVTGVVFSPDGSQLATISPGAVKIWQGEEP